jgi:hypothetical protein
MAKIDAAGKQPTAILELWTPFTETSEQTVNLETKWLNESLTYLKTLNFNK